MRPIGHLLAAGLLSLAARGAAGAAVRVAAGPPALAVLDGGTVYSWDESGAGPVAGLEDVAEAAAAGGAELFLLADGGARVRANGEVRPLAAAARGVAAGGDAGFAVLADGSVAGFAGAPPGEPGAQEARVPEGLQGVASVAAGDAVRVALTEAGEPWLWVDGQDKLLLEREPLLAGVSGVKLAAAGGDTAALLLGNGTLVALTYADASPTPAVASFTDSGKPKQLAVAAGVLFAVQENGTVWAAHANGTVPDADAKLAGIWACRHLKGVASFSPADPAVAASLALMGDGTVRACGASKGVPVPPELHYLAPEDRLRNLRQLAVGGYGTTAHAAAIDTDGLFRLWARSPSSPPGGLNGIHGLPLAAVQYSPSLLGGGLVLLADGTLSSVATGLPLLAEVRSVSMLAVRSQRHWGVTFRNGSMAIAASQDLSALRTAQIGGVDRLAVGDGVCFAVLSDGTATHWADDAYYFSRGLEMDSPPDLAGRRVLQLAAGRAHAVALLDDGTIRTWGGQQAGRSDPLEGGHAVRGAPANLTGVIAVAAGDDVSAAVLANGTLLVWGDEANLQGRGDAALFRGRRFRGVAIGEDAMVGELEGGEVLVWGAWEEQLGAPSDLVDPHRGEESPLDEPVETPTGGEAPTQTGAWFTGTPWPAATTVQIAATSTPSPTPAAAQPAPYKMPTAMLVGIIFGIVVCLALAVGGAVYYVKRRKEDREHAAEAAAAIERGEVYRLAFPAEKPHGARRASDAARRPSDATLVRGASSGPIPSGVSRGASSASIPAGVARGFSATIPASELTRAFGSTLPVTRGFSTTLTPYPPPAVVLRAPSGPLPGVSRGASGALPRATTDPLAGLASQSLAPQAQVAGQQRPRHHHRAVDRRQSEPFGLQPGDPLAAAGRQTIGSSAVLAAAYEEARARRAAEDRAAAGGVPRARSEAVGLDRGRRASVGRLPTAATSGPLVGPGGGSAETLVGPEDPDVAWVHGGF
ncbi:hypothetical protein DFJ74DRAFT_770537 [Hyaloraphidium curvatum]|nr:hypothetical protein DFJ74DRAFT_770537 [Hyaloraphidium curvatum]